jgi:hypothetical protein
VQYAKTVVYIEGKFGKTLPSHLNPKELGNMLQQTPDIGHDKDYTLSTRLHYLNFLILRMIFLEEEKRGEYLASILNIN